MSDNNSQTTPQGNNVEEVTLDNMLGGGLGLIPKEDTPNTPVPTSQQESGQTQPITPVQPTEQPQAPVQAPAQASAQAPAQQQIASIDGEQELLNILLSANGQGLSAEDIQLRTNILTKFGASSADAQGNLLDANGKIVLSKINLDNYIDSGELLLDANGNHVDELGNILTPATEVGAVNSFVSNTKSAIEQEYGFSLTDENGNPKVYENTNEGNMSLIKDVIDTTYVSAVTNFLNSNNDIKQLYYHLQTGGTKEDFLNDTVDYSSIDTSTLSRDQKLDYIKTSFEKQGLKNATSMLNILSGASDDAVNEATNDALLALNKINQDNQAQKEADYNAQLQQQAKEREDYWNGIKGIIDSGKLKDITIPNEEKEKFFNYLALAVDNNGRSQEQLDMANEEPDFNLMVSYLRYKKLDLNQLINIRSRANRLHSVRDRFNIVQPARVDSNPAPNTTNTARDVISLENLTN